MSMVEDTLQKLQHDIDASMQALHAQLNKLRTGRASLAMLDGVRVTYYGTTTPLSHCANLTVADARMLHVRPWDKGLIGEIEKSILASDIGIMPQNDGETIRLPIPQLTHERRRDLVRQAKKQGEDARIGLRNHRRDANDMLRTLEKDKTIGQDELKRALDRVQSLTDAGAGQVDAILAQKEKEITQI